MIDAGARPVELQEDWVGHTSTTRTLSTIAAVRERLDAHRANNESVALVATMGALHEGHLALVREARALADIVVVSIFVNPLQFGPAEDLERYPRTLESDARLLADAGVEVVFAPSGDEMYPDGVAETRVTAGRIGALYEGASRPGHFDGMLTVVAKLLHIVEPDVAVFGQKDAQQVHLVARMVRELDIRASIAVVPTVREADGLALSSRNRYLDGAARERALLVFEALRAADAAARGGVDEALAEAVAALGDHDDIELDYLVVVDPQTFLPLSADARGEALVLIAATVGATRLIDNAVITVG